MLGRNIRSIGVVVAQCLGESFSWCLLNVSENEGDVCIYSQTGIAIPCGAIFKEKCYGSIRGIIACVRVVVTRTSFSLMRLVRPKAMGRGRGGCRGRRPLPVRVELRLVSVGDASKVRKNLVVEDALLFFFKSRARCVRRIVFLIPCAFR